MHASSVYTVKIMSTITKNAQVKKAMVELIESVEAIETVYYATNIVITDDNKISLNDEVVVEYNNNDNESKKTRLYNKVELNAFLEALEENFGAGDVKDFKDSLKESADGVKADLLNQLKKYDLSVLCAPVKSNFIKIELNPLMLMKSSNLHACNRCYNSLITLIEDINKSYKDYSKKLNKLVSLGLTEEAESFENKLEDICNASNYKKISSKIYELFEAFSVSGKVLKATHIANGVFSIKTKKAVKRYEVDKNSLINCLNVNITALFQNASAEDVSNYRQHYNDLKSLQNDKLEAKKAAEDAKKEAVKSSPLEQSLKLDAFKKSLKEGLYIKNNNVIYRINSIEDDKILNCYKFNDKSIKECKLEIAKMQPSKVKIIESKIHIQGLNNRLSMEIMK